MRLHEDDVEVDAALVRRLLSEQFPDLAGAAVTPVPSTGTVNVLFRVGQDLCARLPRGPQWVAALELERRWLPVLTPHLSLRIPVPVAAGRPSAEYPLPWALFDWIPGATYASSGVDDEREAARELAGFVRGLRRVDPTGAPPGGRRPLSELDTVTREAIAASTDDELDRPATLAAWGRALRAPVWDEAPVWVHADLLPPNLLVEEGRLSAVLDFGGAGVGDPAMDVAPAWNVFGSSGRQVFREALDVDAGTWERARGYALHQALLMVPYYRESNPGLVGHALRTVREVLGPG